ncbi:FHA domain-containing protein [Paenibacillus pinihumi]|uniref:FHA domain-containing protein n=1 Tax=Paenibacillus pinihumi TaxID=669462 RepID=UPI0006858AE1|nr:FHA domain-containing protein [Paenibacillus pinihumi]
MSLHSSLAILRGSPFEGGAIIQLQRFNTLLGRKDVHWEPDIAFENIYISRKHASISFEQGNYFIMDLDSKHGTELNGTKLTPFVPAVLGPSDMIHLAKGMIIMTFLPAKLDETMDFSPFSEQYHARTVNNKLDPVRQTIQLHDGSYQFSEKEFRCVELLMRKERQFVSKEEIITCVWPERSAEDALSPVTSEEINSLLYRIRKKTNYGISIESIRGKGYILRDMSAQNTPAAQTVPQ